MDFLLAIITAQVVGVFVWHFVVKGRGWDSDETPNPNTKQEH